MKKHVKNPPEGFKIAGYVGCQTNRPFGINGESFENPVYLDKMIETLGTDSIPDYDKINNRGQTTFIFALNVVCPLLFLLD